MVMMVASAPMRGRYKGIPPSENRLRIAAGGLGSLEVPEPEVLVERLRSSRYGFTVFEDGWVHGTWYCGTKFAPSSYWGQFPGNILRRIQTMFPIERMLHLCSGHAYINGAVNIDIMPTPARDIQADAAALPLRDDSFAVTLIDPPYSAEDALRYGVKRLVSTTAVLGESRRVLVPGGYLVWLDERYPAYRRADWTLMGLIGVVTGFERRSRLLSIFRSTKPDKRKSPAQEER